MFFFVTYCIVALLTVTMCVHVHVYKPLVNVSKSVRPKLNLSSCIIPLVVAAAVHYIHVCVKPTCIYHYVLDMTLVYIHYTLIFVPVHVNLIVATIYVLIKHLALCELVPIKSYNHRNLSPVYTRCLTRVRNKIIG